MREQERRCQILGCELDQEAAYLLDEHNRRLLRGSDLAKHRIRKRTAQWDDSCGYPLNWPAWERGSDRLQDGAADFDELLRALPQLSTHDLTGHAHKLAKSIAETRTAVPAHPGRCAIRGGPIRSA